jgi:hypothetical protein
MNDPLPAGVRAPTGNGYPCVTMKIPVITRLVARLVASLIVAVGVLAGSVRAQGVRSHTRPRSAAISQTQAEELTLTLTQVVVRQIQTWVRTAGSLDPSGQTVTAYLSGPEAALVKLGQRGRAFPVDSRSSMYQAFVSRVVQERDRTRVEVRLVAIATNLTAGYVVEIVAERGGFLSVPTEAIIEEGTSQVVYRQREDGQYEPQTIHTGIQGELYTQVLDGVKEGDQVVTFGSFFIDSEYKLKGATQVGK